VIKDQRRPKLVLNRSCEITSNMTSIYHIH